MESVYEFLHYWWQWGDEKKLPALSKWTGQSGTITSFITALHCLLLAFIPPAGLKHTSISSFQSVANSPHSKLLCLLLFLFQCSNQGRLGRFTQFVNQDDSVPAIRDLTLQRLPLTTVHIWTLDTIIDCLISCLYVLCLPLATWLPFSAPFVTEKEF